MRSIARAASKSWLKLVLMLMDESLNLSRNWDTMKQYDKREAMRSHPFNAGSRRRLLDLLES